MQEYSLPHAKFSRKSGTPGLLKMKCKDVTLHKWSLRYAPRPHITTDTGTRVPKLGGRHFTRTPDRDVRASMHLYGRYALFACKQRVSNAISVNTLVGRSPGLPDLLCRLCNKAYREYQLQKSISNVKGGDCGI